MSRTNDPSDETHPNEPPPQAAEMTVQENEDVSTDFQTFEYHLRQAFHLAENDEVRYHIRKAAQTLRE